jgi:hypothetical protein
MYVRPRCSFGCLPLFALLLLASVALPVPATAEFTDATGPSGLAWFQVTWSGAMADVDLDGDLDIYVGHHFYSPLLYWNDGTGHFDRTLYSQPWSGEIDRHGVLILSLDADEDPEIFIGHGAGAGGAPEANELYRNDGPGAYFLLPDAGGMSDDVGRTRCASAADYDGDRRVDVWVGKAAHPDSPNSLFRNVAPLAFTDVAASAGLDEVVGTVGGIWGDYDNDGDPDLFVGGEEFHRPSVLYRNDKGIFRDASSVLPSSAPIVSGADWGDMDNDGDLDLAVCDGDIGIFDTYSEGDSVTFFFNDRYGDTGVDGLTIPSFTDTTRAVFRVRGYIELEMIFLGPEAVNPPLGPFIPLTDDYVGAPPFTPGVDGGIYVWRESPGGVWEVRCSTPLPDFMTYDGWVTNGSPITGTVPYELEDPGFTPGGPLVWRNNGRSFTDVTTSLGLPLMLNPRDISWVDYDNDGDLDLHVVDMGTSAEPNAPDLLLRNDGAVFTDETDAEGLAGGTLGMGDGGIWGDVDGDGDLDLFLLQGAGPIAFSMFAPTAFYENGDRPGHSIQLDLVGVESGKTAIGSRVTAWVGGQRVHRRVSANSWRGFQDPLRVHLGIGDFAAADSVVIGWNSGLVQVFHNLPAGIWRLEEGSDPTVAPWSTRVESAGRGWRFAGVSPQPGRGVQTIRILSEDETALTFTIHDLAGRRIRSLRQRRVAAGETRIQWDGRDSVGRPVASGVYYVRATDGIDDRGLRIVRLR